jgi:hypothetical protein
MVTSNWPDFTITIICHADLAILRRTLPINLRSLCESTCRTFDVVLMVDGAETAPLGALLDLAREHGIDEVRLRNRARNCASGDPSNNGNVHALTNRTRYLLTLESDVVLFRTEPSFDILDACAQFFDRHPQLPLLQRMDDHQEWIWKLERVAPDIEAGVWSVNRVSTHFLVYNTQAVSRLWQPRLGAFHDSHDSWHNVEDDLSKVFAAPGGPGIATPFGWPMRAYHCDRKITPDSVHYCKSPDVKLERLDQREAEMRALVAELDS